jgi:hypothetical protein
LVSEDTLTALNGRFEYRELSAAQLKGKERPFKVFEILGRQISQGPSTGSPVGAAGASSPSVTDRTPATGRVTER